MYHNIKEQLSKLKNTNSRINPDRSWVLENKKKMMCQIGNNVSDEKSTFSFSYIWDMVNVIVPGQMVYSVVRPVVVFLLIGAVATSGWIASVGATAKSLPGDLGYGVKMAVEKTQQIVTAVTSSDEKEAELYLEFATRRAKEVKEIVKKENEEEATKEETVKSVEIAIQHLEESIDSANDKFKKVTENQPEKVVDASKVVSEKTKEIKTDLKDAEKSSKEGLDMTATKKKVKEANITAVQAVVQVKSEGKIEVSDEDLQGLVKNQIDSILEDVGDLKTETDGVVKDLEDVKVVLDELEDKLEDKKESEVITTSSVDIVAKAGEDSVSASSTRFIGDVEIAVDNVVKKADETEDVLKDLEEVMALVDNNQISEAIERVKEMTDITEKTEQEVSDVKRVISEISKETKDLLGEDVILDIVNEEDTAIDVDTDTDTDEDVEQLVGNSTSTDVIENMPEEEIVVEEIEVQ